MHLLSLGLAAWRLARMGVYEAGPNDWLYALRLRSGIEYDIKGNVVAYPPWNPLHCVLCTSVYTAIIVLVLPRAVVNALAISGIVSLIEIGITEVPE